MSNLIADGENIQPGDPLEWGPDGKLHSVKARREAMLAEQDRICYKVSTIIWPVSVLCITGRDPEDANLYVVDKLQNVLCSISRLEMTAKRRQEMAEFIAEALNAFPRR